jgi:hypothetical protein
MQPKARREVRRATCRELRQMERRLTEINRAVCEKPEYCEDLPLKTAAWLAKNVFDAMIGCAQAARILEAEE